MAETTTTSTASTTAADISRGNRKERLGEVISAKMAKTIVVRVERRFGHPRF
jgi:ribosomal protein S17